jgi:integrase
MGEHKGWRVRQVRDRWVGLFAVVGTGKERSRAFSGPTAKRDAERWARDQAARLRLSAAARQVHRSSTRVLVDDYLADQVTVGRSDSYLRDLRQVLARVVAAVPDLAAPGAAAAIEAFLGDLRQGARRHGLGADVVESGQAVSPRTRNKYLIAIRGLCRWAIRRDRLADDPTRAIRSASEPDYLRAQFTVAELRAMAQAIGHPYHLRFVVAFYCGLRSDEVAGLRWSQLDREGRVWCVVGKGDKQRLAHVPDECLALLDLHPRQGDHVCTERQRRQHDSQHRRDLHGFCRSLGIDPGERSPHSLRHSHAGVMTATGVPSLLLAAHLGHASAQTTAAYTKLATRYLAAVGAWRRGQVELLNGWTVAIANPSPAGTAASDEKQDVGRPARY